MLYIYLNYLGYRIRVCVCAMIKYTDDEYTLHGCGTNKRPK